jgi:nicotinate-nucleotide adenylyltransferase
MMAEEGKSESTAARLGVLGGSFNPVHFGHLHIARRSLEIFGFSQTLFVVASVPPHKPAQDLIPLTHRYAMVCLATAGYPGFIPSLIELEPPASPYSVDTLSKLERRFGVTGKSLFFIAGGDSLLEVSGWHRSEALLEQYNFVFVMRPGVSTPDPAAILPQAALMHIADFRGAASSELRQRLAAELAAPACRIYLVDAEAPDIAASEIRKLASMGRNIGRFVPPTVDEYIAKLHLYGE